MQSQVRFNRVPEKVPEKAWEALVQSQVRCNRVPEKEGSGEGLGGFGAEPGQVQQGSGEGAGEGLGVFGAEPGHVQQGSGEGSGQGLGGFGADPALGFAARFRKICKIKLCGCRGYHRS